MDLHNLKGIAYMEDGWKIKYIVTDFVSGKPLSFIPTIINVHPDCDVKSGMVEFTIVPLCPFALGRHCQIHACQCEYVAQIINH